MAQRCREMRHRELVETSGDYWKEKNKPQTKLDDFDKKGWKNDNKR